MKIETKNYYVQKLQLNQNKTYKKEKIIFDYITPDNFKDILSSANPSVIGSIKLSTIKQTKNVDKVIIESNNETFAYQLIHNNDTNKYHNIIGYVLVADNTYVAVIKKSVIVPILLCIAFIGIIIGLLWTLFKPTPATSDTPSLEFEQGSDWDGNMPQNGEQSKANSESIEIPGYSKLYVSSESPTIQLINPTGNTVYFVYTILENDSIVYESKAIEPSKMIYANLKELLPVGTHDVTFKISTYDTETQAACNGATQEVQVTINE